MFRNAAVSEVDKALAAHERLAALCDRMPCPPEHMDDEKKALYRQDLDEGRDPMTRHLPGQYHPTAQRLARDFLAEQNTEDREELLTRAVRHAQTQTCTYSREASDRAVRAFVGVVEQMIPAPRRQAAHEVTAFEDFEDHLMF